MLQIRCPVCLFVRHAVCLCVRPEGQSEIHNPTCDSLALCLMVMFRSHARRAKHIFQAASALKA